MKTATSAFKRNPERTKVFIGQIITVIFNIVTDIRISLITDITWGYDYQSVVKPHELRAIVLVGNGQSQVNCDVSRQALVWCADKDIEET